MHDDLLCRFRQLVFRMAAELAHSRWDDITLPTKNLAGTVA